MIVHGSDDDKARAQGLRNFKLIIILNRKPL